MIRFLTNQPCPLTVTLTAPGAEAGVDVDSGNVAVVVQHVNGTVLGSGNATHVSTGVYSFTLAPQATPAEATATWTGTVGGFAVSFVTPVKIVGRWTAELAEIRALDGMGGGSAGPSPSTSDLILAREAAEAMFEQGTGVAWVPTYGFDILDGDKTLRRTNDAVDTWRNVRVSRSINIRHRSPRQLLAIYIGGRTVFDGVTTNGSAIVTSASAGFTGQDVGATIITPDLPAGATILSVQSPTSATASATAGGSHTAQTLRIGASSVSTSDLTAYALYPSGEIERPLFAPGWPRGYRNVVLEYVHGRDRMPDDLRRQFLAYVRHLILQGVSRIPERAVAMQTEFGSVQLSTANGWARPTGLPEVDAALFRHGIREPVIA